jgi:hypothetical protein
LPPRQPDLAEAGEQVGSPLLMRPGLWPRSVQLSLDELAGLEQQVAAGALEGLANGCLEGLQR